MTPTSFKSACDEAKACAERMREPLVVGHYDADGVSSTSIVLLGLKAMGKKYRARTLRKLGELEIAELAKAEEKEIICVDFGAAVHRELARLEAQGAKVLIIDHHQASESAVLQVNPHLFGMDGGSELSSSGTAYRIFGTTAGEETIDLALVGAVGDMQAPLIGENRRILKEAEKMGRAKAEKDLALFGRVSRPLVWFLTYSTDVFLPGLTGNEQGCTELLHSLGIPLKDGERWRKYVDLSEGEKKALTGALAALLEKNGLPSANLVGEVYSLTKRPQGTELSDTSEFSTVLNACGRQGKPEVGMALCMGEEGAYEKARALLLKHRTALREGIEYAQTAVEDFGPFYFLDARGIIDDGIVGVVAGMLYSVLERDKPIIAAALDKDNRVKISARGTKQIIARGINLGHIMREAGGPGCGGHAVAAGANIDAGGLENFLLAAGRLMKTGASK
ncbi:DHHA1 domain protein [Candidatus Burarchaeum australiense]|nr:DHHA1 domain protein [Candidatus Burarchaeum australiense]